MLRSLLATAALALLATPALADPWTQGPRSHGPWNEVLGNEVPRSVVPGNQDDSYRPLPAYVYGLPYGYPVAVYSDNAITPFDGYGSVPVRVYNVPLQPPYYNVPPYAVYAPY